MDIVLTLLATLLVPLFPGSWAFNRLIASLPTGLAQGLAVLVLPQLGLEVLRFAPPASLEPAGWRPWGMVWAAASALLYAVRALSARDVGIWSRLMLSSGLGLIWFVWWTGASMQALRIFALSWGVPAAVALFLAGALVDRLGGARLGLQGGLLEVMPRATTALVLAGLALTATPVFPAFFSLWRGLVSVTPAWAVIWLPLIFLWGWAAGRLFQDLLFGDYRGEKVADIGVATIAAIGLLLAVSVVLSLGASGGLS